MNKKTNPHRIPATQADVNKARSEACRMTAAIFLSVLRDKEGYGQQRLVRVWQGVEYLTDSIKHSKVSVDDLRKALLEETGINLIGGQK